MPVTTPNAEQDLGWLWEGDTPTAAEEDDGVRLDMIADDLDRATLLDAPAYFISGALAAARNLGDVLIDDERCTRLLAAVERARRVAVPKLPRHAQGRIATGLDALALFVGHLAGSDALIEAADEADCRDRMRIAQNEAHNRSLIGDIANGRTPGRIVQLLRIVQNEAEILALLAGIAARRRAAARLAA